MSAEISLKISQKYHQILSSEDCEKHRFKNECTLAIIFFQILVELVVLQIELKIYKVVTI